MRKNDDDDGHPGRHGGGYGTGAGRGPKARSLGSERSLGDAARRVISPPRGLPIGRAVLGGLLVALAGLGSYIVAAGGSDTPTTRYGVAAHDLARGDTVHDDDLQLVALDLPADQARGTFPIVDALRGAVMRGPLQAGAILTASAVDQLAPATVPAAGSADGAPTGADPGADGSAAAVAPTYRELAVSVPAARAVGGSLHVGDRVDVVATAGGTSYVLVQHAVVLATSAGRNGPLAGGDVTVTLALADPAAALAVAHGASAAELTLLRSTRAVEPLPGSFQLAGASASSSGWSSGSSPATSAASAATSTAATSGNRAG
jgi:Flp pilus assembly protein CpaB